MEIKFIVKGISLYFTGFVYLQEEGQEGEPHSDKWANHPQLGLRYDSYGDAEAIIKKIIERNQPTIDHEALFQVEKYYITEPVKQETNGTAVQQS